MARSCVQTPPRAIEESRTGLLTPFGELGLETMYPDAGTHLSRRCHGRELVCWRVALCVPTSSRGTGRPYGGAEGRGLVHGGNWNSSSSGPGLPLPRLLLTKCPSWEPLARPPYPCGTWNHRATVLSLGAMETLRKSTLLHAGNMALCFFPTGRPRQRVGVSGAGGLLDLGLWAPGGWLGTGTGASLRGASCPLTCGCDSLCSPPRLYA